MVVSINDTNDNDPIFQTNTSKGFDLPENSCFNTTVASLKVYLNVYLIDRERSHMRYFTRNDINYKRKLNVRN